MTPEVSLDVYTISAFVNLQVTDLGLAVKINCSSLDSLDMHLVLKAATCRIWNLTWLLKPPKSLNGSVLHHHCVWRFTVVFSGSVVLLFFFSLHQRLLFHFIDEDAAIGSGAFLRLPPSEIWVASHSSYKVRSFYSSLFLLGCTHQTWTVTYTWNNSLTASVLHIYSVKISFCLLHVAALTSKTCNSLKKSVMSVAK